MLNGAVSGNNPAFTHLGAGACRKVDWAAGIGAGYASGTFSPQPAEVDADGRV